MIRIVCKAPPQPEGSRINVLASLDDVELWIDGVSVPACAFDSIEWRVSGNHPAVAIVRFVGVEVEVEAIDDGGRR